MWTKLALLIILVPLETLAYVPLEGNVTANLGIYFNRTNFGETPSGIKAPGLRGFGIIANGDVNDKGALEIGLFHLDKVYFREYETKYFAEKTQVIHITMGYRRYISELFSASLGLSSGYTMGEQTAYYTEFPKGLEPNTSARDVTEYGLEMAMQMELWTRERFGIVLDARYSYSLTSKEDERADHYGALLMLRYLVQTKDEEAALDKARLERADRDRQELEKRSNP